MTSNDYPSARRLCVECIGEPWLAEQIVQTGETAVCDYCGRTEKTEAIAEVAVRCEGMIERHFEREGEIDYRWAQPRGETAEDLIVNVGLIEEEPARDLQAVMEERHSDFEMAAMGEPTEYSEEITYVRRHADIRDLQESWDALETELKTRHRFFSREAESGFGRLFADLDGLRTGTGQPVVRTIGPDTDLAALFRARAFPSTAAFEEALIDPERLVGTPASAHARPGRMNAQGVAVFYGATTEALALAEVRPPVGSRVILGRFELLRALRILDVDALESLLVTGSLFDPSFEAREALGVFLGRLAHRIRMPVMPGDEATDYLITQVMADYLAVRVDPPLDGVAYGSAQGGTDAFNVALFHRAARVKAAKTLPGETHDVSGHFRDEDPGPYYVWTEYDPEPPADTAPKAEFDFRALYPIDPVDEDDLRSDTLALDRDRLRVHHIRRITVETEVVGVTRHARLRGEDPF